MTDELRDDTRLVVVEREVRGMHETLKELSTEIKQMTKALTRYEQMHEHQQRVSENSQRDIESLQKDVNDHKLDIARMNGGVGVLKIILGFFGTATIGSIGWLLSVVINTQQAVQLHQSQIPTLETRIAQLERSKQP